MLRRGKSIEAIAPGLFKAYDNRPKDQWVDFHEFMIIELIFAQEDMASALGLIFQVFDRDDNGSISQDEMEFAIDVLYKSLEDYENPDQLSKEGLCKAVFKELDTDNNKEISKEEFVNVLSSQEGCEVS